MDKWLLRIKMDDLELPLWESVFCWAKESSNLEAMAGSMSVGGDGNLKPPTSQN